MYPITLLCLFDHSWDGVAAHAVLMATERLRPTWRAGRVGAISSATGRKSGTELPMSYLPKLEEMMLRLPKWERVNIEAWDNQLVASSWRY